MNEVQSEFIKYCCNDTESRDYSDVIVAVHPSVPIAALTVLGNTSQKSVLEQIADKYGEGVYKRIDTTEYSRNGKYVCVVTLKEETSEYRSLYERFILAQKAYYRPEDSYLDSLWSSFTVARLMKYCLDPSGRVYFPIPYAKSDKSLKPACQLPAALLSFVKWGKSILEGRNEVKGMPDVMGQVITMPVNGEAGLSKYIEELVAMFDSTKELWDSIPRNSRVLRDAIGRRRQTIELESDQTKHSHVIRTRKDAEEYMLSGGVEAAKPAEDIPDQFSETLSRIGLLEIPGQADNIIVEAEDAVKAADGGNKPKRSIEETIMMYMYMNEDEIFFHNYII